MIELGNCEGSITVNPCFMCEIMPKIRTDIIKMSCINTKRKGTMRSTAILKVTLMKLKIIE